jgi:membrane protease YdiL (CAAX protease family)
LRFGKVRYGHEMFWGLALLTAIGLIVGIRWVWRGKRRFDPPGGSGLTFAFRWGMIGVLFVAYLIIVILQPRQNLLSWVGRVWPLILFVYCCNACLRELKHQKPKLNA